MEWIKLDSTSQLDGFLANDEPIIIFKHSTRCPVSSMAKRSLEFDKDIIPAGLKFYFLDLIAHRDISNQISTLWNVKHESPQILIIKGKDCIYNASHSDIEMQDIISYIN